MNNVDLFNTPISSRKVRKNVYAYRYSNMCINIAGIKYFDYSMAEAIKLFRLKHPLKNSHANK